MSPRARAALSAVAVALPVLVAPVRSARAWVDVHVEADDVRVTVEKSGDARVEHRITLKIAGGPLRSIDLKGVDADAAPDPESYVVPQKEAARASLASAVPAIAERLPLDIRPRPDGSPAPTVLRVRFDPPKGLGRGVYVLLLRYATHLPVERRANAALARIAWKSPVWDDGLDSARVTFDLPAAPTPPRPDDVAAPEGAPGPPTVLSTVRRGVSRDQIELLRPYAPKGEPITWAIRADPRALQPAPVPPARPGVGAAIAGVLGDSTRRAIGLGVAFALFVAFSVLVALKAAEAGRLARAAGTEARPLVPLPAALRAVLAGALLVGGIFVETALMRATLGAILVVAATALAAHRTPAWGRAPLRGKGRWLPVSLAEALREAPRAQGAIFDVSTRAGKAILVLLLAAVGGLAAWIHETSPHCAWLVAMDAVAILAVFGTGRLAELPPDPATAPVRLLRDVARRVEKALPEGDVRLLGRIRVPEGESRADELRLGAQPRTAPPGFGAIEVGVVHLPGAGGPIALPEVILRVAEGSPCEAAIEGLLRHGRSARGRRPGERAVVFSPRLPTARMTAGIVATLVRALTSARTVRPGNVGPRETRHAA
jgi:hypothetical protein